ncbi:hypothetical protein H0H92_005121 [Tricholoma furcatifolium]|nr:hypothetical protein H0H92_005121 [Tricholoma furcatifolium]
MSTQSRRARCGTHRTPEQIAAMERDFQERIKASARREAAPKYTLKVYFHVISEDDTVAGGNITDDAIARQIDVLNEAYHDINIRWILAETTRTINGNWFNNSLNPKHSAAMKNSLHRGSPADLNVYTVRLNENVLGYATSPVQYQKNAFDENTVGSDNDGVVIRSATVPESDLTHFRITSAQTLVHYTARWIGLYRPEEDIMEYSDDSWTPSFTVEQISLASEQLKTYRGL